MAAHSIADAANWPREELFAYTRRVLATLALHAALGGLLMAAAPAGDAAPSGAATPDQLRAIAHDYYVWSLEDQPVASSDRGLHTWDDRLTDYSPASVGTRIGKAASLLPRIDAMDVGGWSVDDRIDHALFRADLEAVAFASQVLRPEKRDPGLYVSECSNAVFSLLKKEYAPRAQRARAATRRLEAMPALLDQGLRNLDEAVPLLARFAIESVEGIGPLFHESLMTLAEDLPKDDRARLEAARDRALAALRDYASQLKSRMPAMTAPLAMGVASYNRMLSRILLLPVDADFVASLGQSELARAKAMESWLPDPNLAEVAGPGPGAKVPRDQQEFLAGYEARTKELVAHIERRGILTIPSHVGEFKIQELPRAFKPTSPGGFMNPPGLFDKDATGFFFLPTYDPNSPNFYLRAALQDARPILGHEGIPGHFLQISIAHRHPSEIRRMHDDGVFVEGWALYGEEMMQRTGLYDDAPGGYAQVLRLMRYRAARITVDVKLHTGAWSFDQAVDYFMKEGGLDRESATGEAAGAAATPGQKIHYTLGKWQINRLLGRWRDAKGAAFTLRGFHDALLSQGSIPLALAEWAMLGDDASYREALRLSGRR